MTPKYYKFPHSPVAIKVHPKEFTRVINMIPGDIVIDEVGNVYQVNTNYKADKIITSYIEKKYWDKGVKGLNANEMKLFCNITNYYIKHYFNPEKTN